MRTIPGAIDASAVSAQAMARAVFCETVRLNQPRFWSALIRHRRTSSPVAAEALCRRRYLVDDWILPQLWYEAGLEVRHPGLDRTSVPYMFPALNASGTLVPEPEPASELRAQYIRRIAKLAGERYDVVVAARIEKGARRIVLKPQRHYDWLVSFVFGKKSINAIWEDSQVASVSTVRDAVLELADSLGLTLRKTAPGRPTETQTRR